GEMTVTLGAAVAKNGPRQQYMRATLTCTPSGERVATPVETQDSSLLSALARADCLIVRPPHAPALEAGTAVSALPLDF
ncbi:MAG: molybdopterin molybdenumtransferase MoeA, partial [Alphaproteobacteria bacterium]